MKRSPPSPCTVGIIGLGIMGSRMAGALVGSGYRVIGFDPLARCRKALQRHGGEAMRSNAEVARQADILITSLPGPAALHGVVAELAGVAPPARGQVFIETSTLTLQDKQQAAAVLAQQGRQMLDAPISGTASGEPQTSWIAYLSGPAGACRKAAPVLRCFTVRATRVGPLGSGTKLKYAANHLVAIHNVACAEMMVLCERMGLDPAIALDLLGSSPYLGTGLMRIRMPMMMAREYTPATMKVHLWQKDMQVIGDAARALHCPTPLLDACASLYTAAMAHGHAEHDTASVAEVLRGLAGDLPHTR
jgi:L-threonate 2-dehydrogenase